MTYIITDWMSNVCFDSENENLTDFDEESEQNAKEVWEILDKYF